MVAAFEPEPGMWVARLDHWALLHRTVDHPAFKLAMDVGHVHCNREGDPAWLLRGYREALADVQVEDARAGEHVHLPFGEGTLDIGPTLVALDQIAYRGHVVVELSRDSHRAVEVAGAAITHMKRFVP
jgi:sugar phosphate isomerase/epimerase